MEDLKLFTLHCTLVKNAYLFLIERTLARYGYTAEIKITRKSEEEEKASEQSET